MTTFFLAYAESDGQTAADALRVNLQAMGFAPAPRLPQADALLALLTPAGVASLALVTLWETALALGKPVLPVRVAAVPLPPTLAGLPLYALDDAAAYALGLARLAAALLASVPRGGGNVYQVGAAIHSAVGERPLVINAPGGGEQAAALAQTVAFLLRQERGGLSTEQAAELQAILRQMQSQMGQGFAAVQARQMALSARFDETARSLHTVIVARLDAQEARLTDEIVAVLESGAVAADELDRHLAVIERAVGQARSTDPVIQQAVVQAQELLSAPNLDTLHRLKVTLPLLPFFLSYEGEMELGQGLNLEMLWEKMKGWVRGTPT